MPMSCSDAHAVSASDRKFLEASVGALQSYKNDLEMAINYLASHETDSSAALMADCLKVTDALNTIITVYHEVHTFCSTCITCTRWQPALSCDQCVLEAHHIAFSPQHDQTSQQQNAAEGRSTRCPHASATLHMSTSSLLDAAQFSRCRGGGLSHR